MLQWEDKQAAYMFCIYLYIFISLSTYLLVERAHEYINPDKWRDHIAGYDSKEMVPRVLYVIVLDHSCFDSSKC